TFTYDRLNRRKGMTEDAGGINRRSSLDYDANNNITQVTDARGIVTGYTFDALNRRTQMVEAQGRSGEQRTSTFAYDAVNNMTGETHPQTYDSDPNQVRVRTQYVYDGIYRLTRTVENQGDSLERTTVTVYDPVGNLLKVTRPADMSGNPARVTQFTYDAL